MKALNTTLKDNAITMHLLALSPLLTLVDSTASALGLALIVIFTLITARLSLKLLKNITSKDIQFFIFLIIIYSLITAIELLSQAFIYEIYRKLEIFLPLIAINCFLYYRPEVLEAPTSLSISFAEGLKTGIQLAAIIVIFGIAREILGAGKLFTDMNTVFGNAAQNWTINIFETSEHFLLLLLSPGVFIFIGLLIAFKNFIDSKSPIKDHPQDDSYKTRRARITGVIN